MPIDTNNEEQVKEAYEYMQNRVGDFYSSSLYGKAQERYENRVNSYKCRTNQSKEAQWRSKLYMPTFFLGCKALEAQFKQTHRSDPFIWVKPMDNSRIDPEAKEKAMLAQADLNYDLQIAHFLGKKVEIDWYLTVFGVGIGREYVRSYQKKDKIRSVGMDGYGFFSGVQEQEMIKRVEHTCTQVIHPLNFAHEIDKRNFMSSTWGSVRFMLHISEIYKMLNNENYYQPGVKKLIGEYEKHGAFNVPTTGSEDYYSENIDEVTTTDYVVVDEYSGPIWLKGGKVDFTRYLSLYCKAYHAVLRIGQSPFARHPYWKVQCYPDPDGPFGVDPNAMLRPINLWENSTINQYVDYMNSALKFMYKVNPSAISGGTNALINGLPFGMLMLEKNQGDLNLNSMIDTIKREGTIPPVGDVIQLINQMKQEVGPSSNLRGRDGGQPQTDTATGISLLAQREDIMTEAIQEGVDEGIQDCMSMKLANMVEFFGEERAAMLRDNGGQELVSHYPFELAGMDYSFKVERKLADVEAGKQISFLRLVTGMDQLMSAKGTPLPPQVLIEAYESVGRSLGIRGVDDIFRQIRQAATAAPPQVGAMPGMGGAPAALGMGMGAPAPAPAAPEIPIGAGQQSAAAALA